MRWIGIVLAVLGIAAGARAQDAGAPLVAALQARYPTNEILPISCNPARGELQGVAGRICVLDHATGLPRAVRRVALVEDGGVELARHGDHVFFAIGDYGGATTRYVGRAWQWDLRRDAYLGLGNLSEDYAPAELWDLPDGVVFRAAGGPRLATGAGTRAVGVDPEIDYLGPLLATGGASYALRDDAVQQISIEGTRVRVRRHAALPGELVWAGEGAIVTFTVGRAGRVILHVLRPPATTPVDAEMPPRTRSPRRFGTFRVDDHTIELGSRPRMRLDVATGALSPVPADVPAFQPLLASSFFAARALEGGVYLESRGGRFVLGAEGATPVARAPRFPRARCHCEEAALHCGESTIAGACADVQELEQVRTEYEDAAQRSVQHTAEGRFRVDRLEADLVRVTRLRDGARLWVRMYGPALFAQADDGSWFSTDRALVARMAIRRGRAILDAPVAPFGPAADALFRERLIADFFAP